jgi:hypothetical protein
MALNLFPNLNPAMRQKSQGEYYIGLLKGTADATDGKIDYTTIWKYGVQIAEDFIFDDLVNNEIELNLLDGYYEAAVAVFKSNGNDSKLAELENIVLEGRKSVLKENVTI